MAPIDKLVAWLGEQHNMSNNRLSKRQDQMIVPGESLTAADSMQWNQGHHPRIELQYSQTPVLAAWAKPGRRWQPPLRARFINLYFRVCCGPAAKYGSKWVKTRTCCKIAQQNAWRDNEEIQRLCNSVFTKCSVGAVRKNLFHVLYTLFRHGCIWLSKPAARSWNFGISSAWSLALQLRDGLLNCCQRKVHWVQNQPRDAISKYTMSKRMLPVHCASTDNQLMICWKHKIWHHNLNLSNPWDCSVAHTIHAHHTN